MHCKIWEACAVSILRRLIPASKQKKGMTWCWIDFIYLFIYRCSRSILGVYSWSRTRTNSDMHPYYFYFMLWRTEMMSISNEHAHHQLLYLLDDSWITNSWFVSSKLVNLVDSMISCVCRCCPKILENSFKNSIRTPTARRQPRVPL